MRPKTVILVVDDEPLVRIPIVVELARAGFEVLEAESATEAIAILEKREDMNIVFTDVHLNDNMNGLELLRLIAGRWPPIRLFATSGAAVVARDELPVGARFLPKPYEHSLVVSMFESELR